MHVIEVNHGAGELHRYILLPDASYTVGRKECHILLPTGDPSISRHHADIQVGVMQSRAVTDPSVLTAEVSLQDNSKHGTLVNDELVGRGNSRYVYTEDSIKFGKRVTARVVSVRIVLVESSQLLHEERKMLRNMALLLGALIVQEPAPSLLSFFDMRLSCTAFLYITHNGYTVTPETLLAQQRGYHITTIKYLQLLEKTLSEDCAKGMEELPQPTVAQPGDVSFPVVECMRPPRVFYDIHEFLLSKPLPNKLLRNYTFVFAEVGITKKYEALLKHCGASVVHPSQKNAAVWHSLVPDDTSLVVASDDIFSRVKRAVLTKPDRGGTTGEEGNNGGSEHSPVPLGELAVSIYITLYQRDFVIIPERNIVQAAFTGNPLEINSKPSAPYLLRSEGDMLRSPSPVVRGSSHSFRSNSVSTILSHRGASAEQVVMPAGEDEKLSSYTLSPPPRRASSVSEGAMKTASARALCEIEGNILKVVETAGRLGCEGETIGNTLRSKSTASSGGGGNGAGAFEVASGTRKSSEHEPSTNRPSDEWREARAANTNGSSARSHGQHYERSPEGSSTPWDKQAFVVVHTAEQLWKNEGGKISSSRARMSAYKMSKRVSSTSSGPPPPVGNKTQNSIERRTNDDGRSSIPQFTSSRSFRSTSPLARTQPVAQSSSRRLVSRQTTAKFIPYDEPGIHGTVGSASPLDTPHCHTARCGSSGRPAKRQLLAYWQRSAARDKVREAKSARLPSSPLRSYSPMFQRYNSGTGSSRRGVGIKGNGGSRSDVVRGERYAGLFSPGGPSSSGVSGALLAHQQDTTIRKRCEEFLRKVLTPLNAEVDTICRLIMRQGYLDAESKKRLEKGTESLIKFLTYIQRIETSIPPSQSTGATRAVTSQVRQKSVLLRRRIKTAYESVKAEIPSWLNQLHDVLSGRPLAI